MKALWNSDYRYLMFAVVALSVFGVISSATQQTQAPYLSVRGTSEGGARALWEWLDALDYRPRELLHAPLSAADLEAYDALLILAPLFPYEEDEAEIVAEWVRDGGWLLVAGAPLTINTLLNPYDLSIDLRDDFDQLGDEPPSVGAAAPTLLRPPFEALDAAPVYQIVMDRPDAVVHLSSRGLPTVVSVREGAGEVWLSATGAPFSNLGLQATDNARFASNLLASLPQRSVIAFDEARHGFSDVPQTLNTWLLQTPPGWGVLLLIGLTMLYLGFSGRRFGRPVPLQADRLRREPVEYISALALLYRRSGLRDDTLHHFKARLIRRLAERYGFDARLPDAEIIKTVTYRDERIEAGELRDLLSLLSRSNVSERDLVSATRALDAWVEHYL